MPRPSCCLLLFCLTIAGCVDTRPQRGPAASATAGSTTAGPAPAQHAVPESTRRAVAVLLAEADRAVDELRLTTPADDNALDRYLQVLVLIPDEPRARAGIARIVARYRSLALQAAAGGNGELADHYLDIAGQIAPDDAGLADLRRRVDAVAAAPVERVALDQQAVAGRDPALARRLAALGTRAKQQGLFVVIRAPRDAWGRWIYQQMNDAPPALRLRARSEVAREAALELTPLAP